MPEIEQVLLRAEELGDLARLSVLGHVSDKKGQDFPILKLAIGSTDPKAPVLGIVGGVHGLERIGAQVVVSYMNSLANLMLWDQMTRTALEKIRIFFIPMVNPAGTIHRQRSNANGVDLMRNAPVEADKPYPLLGGHYLSPKLPWYRGPRGGPMELESQFLIQGVEDEIRDSVMPLTIDIHSGFGMQDQLWFPYARTTKPFPHLPVFHAMTEILDRTYPYHFYKIEPQAINYTTHGDLWDLIYDNSLLRNPKTPYLPLCLEMGSWMWIKKNPWQIFMADGPFNPLKKHRERRVLRRHNTLFEFFIKALMSTHSWMDLNEEQLHKHQVRAMERWYQRGPELKR